MDLERTTKALSRYTANREHSRSESFATTAMVKFHFQDINSELPRMSLKDVIQLDWKAIAPELTAMTINSLPMSTLSAIPWDDVFKVSSICYCLA